MGSTRAPRVLFRALAEQRVRVRTLTVLISRGSSDRRGLKSEHSRRVCAGIYPDIVFPAVVTEMVALVA